MKGCLSTTLIAAVALSAAVTTAQDVPREAPGGFGQLETPPKLIPGGIDEDGREYYYNGQPSVNGKIVLTANNGFFTNGTCRAAGQSSLPKMGDDELIQPNFAYLENWNNTEGTLRWHFQIANPGPVRFQTFLEVPDGADGSKIEFQFGGETKTVSATASDGNKPQPWDVVFNVKKPGEYCLALQARQITNPSGGVGNLKQIEAFGPAIAEAHLLRVRWRPAAVHGGYESDRVRNPKVLVMTTRSMTPVSNYSPVTTPFGYFGTSFTADRRSNGEFNFSMWGKEDEMSDLKQMPHLLGIGSPEGEFSGFGHEGSGVKARGWTPMPDQPELCVQALRVEPGEFYDSYFGYYFDHPTNAWKFYCGGNKWHDGKAKTELKVGSFCEVPGPPQSERSGDIYREVQRRGWYHNDAGKWVQLETFTATGAGARDNIPVNKRWYTAKDGSFAMGCGGIRLYKFSQKDVTPTDSTELPYFLKGESIATLFQLPVEFNKIEASAVSGNSAVISVDIKNNLGELSDGTVYFGKTDALTFAPRELHGTEKNSDLSKAIAANSWQKSQTISQAINGENRIPLSDLEPETTYYYRVLINNSVSRIWNNRTLAFTTSKAGSAPTSTATEMLDEPFRTWKYSAGGEVRQLEGKLTKIEDGKIEIERKEDGKKGQLDLKILSKEDQDYISTKS